MNTNTTPQTVSFELESMNEVTWKVTTTSWNSFEKMLERVRTDKRRRSRKDREGNHRYRMLVSEHGRQFYSENPLNEPKGEQLEWKKV